MILLGATPPVVLTAAPVNHTTGACDMRTEQQRRGRVQRDTLKTAMCKPSDEATGRHPKLVRRLQKLRERREHVVLHGVRRNQTCPDLDPAQTLSPPRP